MDLWLDYSYLRKTLSRFVSFRATVRHSASLNNAPSITCMDCYEKCRDRCQRQGMGQTLAGRNSPSKVNQAPCQRALKPPRGR